MVLLKMKEEISMDEWKHMEEKGLIDKTRLLEHVSEGDWKALARTIDGEGFISLTLNCGYLIPVIGITNTSEEYLTAIQNEIGVGHIFFSGQQKGNQRQCYQLSIYGRDKLRVILTKTIPYLIIKKKLAQTLLEWLDYRVKRGHGGYTQADHNFLLKCREHSRAKPSGKGYELFLQKLER